MNFDIVFALMLPALQLLAKITHSYGWAIILLTLAIRLISLIPGSKSRKTSKSQSDLKRQLERLKRKYKHSKEKLNQKLMEFYLKNIPFTACLSALIQYPILMALCATFWGPPFNDRVIDVRVTVCEAQNQAYLNRKETSASTSLYVSPEGKIAKLALFPGESEVKRGDVVYFGVRAIDGGLTKSFNPTWSIVDKTKHTVPSEVASVTADGRAVFSQPGEYHVQATVAGIAKRERFGFIDGLGKVARGLDLLRPSNWDSLCLIVLYGFSFALMQRLNMRKQELAYAHESEEQKRLRRDAMRVMPFAVTGLFFFAAFPNVFYLYMIVFNLIQTVQTSLSNVLGG